MKELFRSTNLVEISWASAILGDAGIEAIVLDGHFSVLEGSLAIVPRRLMVADEDAERARQIITDARPPDG